MNPRLKVGGAGSKGRSKIDLTPIIYSVICLVTERKIKSEEVLEKKSEEVLEAANKHS